MERQIAIKNPTKTIKETPQSVKKTGKPIFVYLRMSTKKKNQEDSIENQNNKVLRQVRSLGINVNDIQRFEDAGITGFKNIKTKDGKILSRPREGLTKLLSAIDALKVPCLLFAYDPSRLARNSNDGGVIIERLGHNGNKQKMEKIYFSMGDGVIWDSKTPKTDMLSSFILAEKESEKKASYMKDNISEHLGKKIFPPMTPTPPGLKATKNGLEITDKMQYVQRAMEMRIAGEGLSTIHKYISSHGIKTSLTSITNSIFLNSLYIGIYQDRQGEIFENLRFVSGKPPISPAFFAELKKHIGKKTGGYGEKQENGDIITKLLSWEQDINKTKSFSLDTKKGKHKNYKSSSFGGFSKSETKILKDFIDQAIPKIIDIYFSFYSTKRNENDKKLLGEFRGLREIGVFENKSDEDIRKANEELKRMELENEKNVLIMTLYTNDYPMDRLVNMTHSELIEESLEQSEYFKSLNEQERLDRRKRIFILQNTPTFKELEITFEYGFKEYWKKYGDANSIETSNFLASIEEIDKGRLDAIENGKDRIIKLLKDSYPDKLNKDKDFKREQIVLLQEKYNELKDQKEEVYIKYADMGYNVSVADKKAESIDNELQSIASEINELGESSNIEQFMERLPDVLFKTFELASNMLSNADIDSIRSDMRQLIEIVTFELQINTKKELTVKLFDGLNDMSFLTGPPDKNRTCV